MEIVASARKHGVSDEDILHAWEHAMYLIEFEHSGETRLFVIGGDTAGRLLELVAVPAAEPLRIIHADALRETFYDYMR